MESKIKELELIDNLNEGFVCHKIIYGENKIPAAYTFFQLNNKFEEIFKLQREEVMGKQLSEVKGYFEKLDFNWLDIYNEVALTAKKFEFQSQIETSNHNSELKYYDIAIYKLKEDYLLTTFIDITKHQLASDQLEKSGCCSVLDSISSHIAVLDQEGIIKHTNQAWKEFAIENEADVKVVNEGVNYLQACYQAENDSRAFNAAQGLEAVMTRKLKKFSLEYPCHSPTEKRWFKMYVTPLNRVDGAQVIVVHENITERKLFEISLKRKSYEQQLLLDNIDMQVWYLKDPETYGAVNRAHAEFLGLEKENLENEKIIEIIEPPVARDYIEGNKKIFARKRKIKQEKWRANKDGQQRLLAIIKTPKLDAQGEVEYVVCSAQDITEERMAKKSLKRQAKLRELINELSGLFINLFFERIDSGINFALEKLGEFAEVDRCYIFLFLDNNQQISKAYEWTADQVDSAIDSYQNLSRAELPWFMEELINSGCVHIPSLENLPQKADKLKSLLIAQGTKSLLAVPITYQNSLIGFIGFNSIIQEKSWSQDIISLLKIAGDMFASILERKETEKRLTEYTVDLEFANMQLESISARLENRIEKAKELHNQFLPTDFPQIESISFATHYQPAEKLGGDFYNLIQIKNNLIIYLVDITGHGLDGAMLNIFVRESINSFLLAEHEQGERIHPQKIIEFIYEKYCRESFPDDYFICLLLGVLDLEKMSFTFSNAGLQIPPMLSDSNGNLSVLSCSGPPISAVLDKQLFQSQNIEEETFDFEMDSTLLLTTDGLIEESRNGEIYGEQRLKEVFKKNSQLAPDLIIEAINEDLENYTDSLEGQDDITILVTQRTS